MYESTHIETTVTPDDVLNIFKKHLKEMGVTATITARPPIGYKEPRLLTWCDADTINVASEEPAGRYYITDDDNNVFALNVTGGAFAQMLGLEHTTVTAKSLTPYTEDDYRLYNTTTRISDIPQALQVSTHGYNGARSVRDLQETPVGEALTRTVHDIVKLPAPDTEANTNTGVLTPGGWFASPEENDETLFTAGHPATQALVNQYGAVIGYKATLGRSMSHMTAFSFIGALVGLNLDTEMITDTAPIGYEPPKIGDILHKLGLNFPATTFTYFVTRNNETYLLLAGEETVRVSSEEEPRICTTVVIIRLTPSTPWYNTATPVTLYGDVPVSEDMRHSYYGRALCQATKSLQEGTIRQMEEIIASQQGVDTE
jgi:hypothetical protein